MQKKLMLSIMLTLFTVVAAMADDKERYQKLAETIRNEVWSKDLPAFNQRSCPEEFKSYSAVVLAAYNEVTVDQHLRANIMEMLFTYSVGHKVTANNCTRRLIAINDERARDEYAEFDFSAIWKTAMHKRQAVMGMRVIKPSGEVREVNADDFVVIDEGRSGRHQRRKLAVPDLQVGDLIDYFYYTIDDIAERSIEPFVIQLLGDMPILSFQIHCVIDRDLTTQYRTLNGAPDFTASTDDEGNIVLDLEIKDQTETAPRLWYNSAEQAPRILLYISGRSLKGEWRAPSLQQKGLQANPHFSTIVDDDVQYRSTTHFGNGITRYALWGKDLKEWRAYCDRVAAMDITKEERVARLYTGLIYLLRFSRTGQLSSGALFGMLSEALQKQGITSHQLFTTSDQAEPIDQLISYRNTTWGLYLMSIDKVLLPPSYDMSPFTIPAAFQGRPAILDDGNGQIINLPRSTPDDNQMCADVSVTFPGIAGQADSPTLLRINRRCAATGAQRESPNLLYVMSDRLMADAFRYMGIDRELTDLVGKKYRDDMEESIRQLHEEERQLYAAEAKMYHGTDIGQLIDYSMENIGFLYGSDTLVYRSSYDIDGLVKRAGQNLMLDVGRLFCQQLKVEGAERQRRADIHYGHPACRLTYRYTIELPEGYVADSVGLACLNTCVDNSCGSFSTEAAVDGRQLRLTIVKCYQHAEEPLEKWSEVLEFVDAAASFNAAQLILRRE